MASPLRWLRGRRPDDLFRLLLTAPLFCVIQRTPRPDGTGRFRLRVRGVLWFWLLVGCYLVALLILLTLNVDNLNWLAVAIVLVSLAWPLRALRRRCTSLGRLAREASSYSPDDQRHPARASFRSLAQRELERLEPWHAPILAGLLFLCVLIGAYVVPKLFRDHEPTANATVTTPLGLAPTACSMEVIARIEVSLSRERSIHGLGYPTCRDVTRFSTVQGEVANPADPAEQAKRAKRRLGQLLGYIFLGVCLAAALAQFVWLANRWSRFLDASALARWYDSLPTPLRNIVDAETVTKGRQAPSCAGLGWRVPLQSWRHYADFGRSITDGAVDAVFFGGGKGSAHSVVLRLIAIPFAPITVPFVGLLILPLVYVGLAVDAGWEAKVAMGCASGMWATWSWVYFRYVAERHFRPLEHSFHTASGNVSYLYSYPSSLKTSVKRLFEKDGGLDGLSFGFNVLVLVTPAAYMALVGLLP